MKSFCVSKEGNTDQDIQDLFDLAVWSGCFAEDYINGTKKMFEYQGGFPFSNFNRFGVLFGNTWAYPLECYKEISYKEAINLILESNYE